jgi:hypothetical protein
MKTARILSCLYSVVAILAVLFYLTGVAMAEPPKKDKRQDANGPMPEHDSFDNSGSDTFENSPTPTFTPEPPRPEKKDDKEKGQKEKKEKKDKGGDGVVAPLAVTDPDLTIIGLTVTPSGATAGASSYPGQNATLTVVIKNLGSSTAENFVLDNWFRQPAGAPPPNFGSVGNAFHNIASLAPNAIATFTYPFTFNLAPGASFAWSIVDSGSAVTETKEFNNRTQRLYNVVGVSSVIPSGTIFAVGIPGSVTFRVTTIPANVNWPPGYPQDNRASLTLGSISACGSKLGEATFTYNTASPVAGTEIFTINSGPSSNSGVVKVVGVQGMSPLHFFVMAGDSVTFHFATNPSNSAWPVSWPRNSLSLSYDGLGTITRFDTATGSGTISFRANGTSTIASVSTLTVSSGTSTDVATITLMQIDFIDNQSRKLPAVRSVPADYLKALAATLTSGSPMSSLDSQYLEEASFRIQIVFRDDSLITTRSVNLIGRELGGFVQETKSIEVTRQGNSPYVSEKILAYHGTLTDDEKTTLGNHFILIHNSSVVVAPPFAGFVEEGKIAIKGLKAIQAEASARNRIIYEGGVTTRFSVEPQDPLALALSRAYEKVGGAGFDKNFFKHRDSLLLCWDFTANYTDSPNVTSLTWGGKLSNGSDLGGHLAENLRSFLKDATGGMPLSQVKFSENDDSISNVKLPVTLPPASENYRKTYMLLVGFSNDRYLHPVEIAQLAQQNQSEERRALFIGPFRVRMSLERFIGDPCQLIVNGQPVAVDGTNQLLTNTWLQEKFIDTEYDGVRITDTAGPTNDENIPVRFGIVVPSLKKNAQGEPAFNQDSANQTANAIAESVAKFYGCYPYPLAEGGQSLVGRRLQLGTIQPEGIPLEDFENASGSVTDSSGNVFTYDFVLRRRHGGLAPNRPAVDNLTQALAHVTPTNVPAQIGNQVVQFELPCIDGVILFRPAFVIRGEVSTIEEIKATLIHERVHLKQYEGWRDSINDEINRKFDPTNPQPSIEITGGKYSLLRRVVDDQGEPIFWELEAYFEQMIHEKVSYRFLDKNGTVWRFKYFYDRALESLANPIDLDAGPIPPNTPPTRILGHPARKAAAKMLISIFFSNDLFEEMRNETIRVVQQQGGSVVVQEFKDAYDIQIDPPSAVIIEEAEDEEEPQQ